jgi:protein-arginine kinase activator protein McsA
MGESVCESCELVPATVLVVVENAGKRVGFRVCVECAADGVATGRAAQVAS